MKCSVLQVYIYWTARALVHDFAPIYDSHRRVAAAIDSRSAGISTETSQGAEMDGRDAVRASRPLDSHVPCERASVAQILGVAQAPNRRRSDVGDVVVTEGTACQQKQKHPASATPALLHPLKQTISAFETIPPSHPPTLHTTTQQLPVSKHQHLSQA